MSKHTPGPWKVADYLVVTSKGTVYTFENETTKAGELRANARLIAGAPETLAALEALVEVAQHQLSQRADHEGLTNCDTLAGARAAIRKAKGEVSDE